MIMAASEQLLRLIERLKEIFEIDKSDLDFGIYRIMNIRKKEIEKFLSEGLPKRVQETLTPFAMDTSAIENRIKEIEGQLGDSAAIAALPQTIPMVKEYADLKAQLAKGVDLSGLEADVYSHLLSFFSRYYEEGDFISKRRYKEGVYAIPYEGEEVKLYWANQDQYYIKTSENFKDYTFVADGYSIHFRLVDATTEKDNNKETSDSKRVFMLYNETEENPEIKTFEFDEEHSELIIRFVFDVPPDKKFDYAADNEKRITTWIANECKPLFMPLLGTNVSNDPKKNLTLLGKHLKSYVAKNTFDYFIHKDLGGFLTRELDFYIKNEVMHLDDVDTTDEKKAETWLAQVRAIKRVGSVIIDFLAQIENFQKKLWLKKKFVVSTNYCITLDRVPEEFYPEIAANDAQRDEWVRLFAIDEILNDLEHQEPYSVPLTVEFLKQNQNLVLDTRFFSDDFKERLVATIDNFDAQCDGLLIHSENFQALNFISKNYEQKIECIYVDPPYNTGDSEILYKNNYMHSSWVSFIENRFFVSKKLLSDDYVYFVAIDDFEMVPLSQMIDSMMNMKRAMVVVNHHPQGGKAKILANTHEYMLVLIDKESERTLVGKSDTTTTEERAYKRSGTAESNYRIHRLNSFYALLVDRNTKKVIGIEPPPSLESKYPLEDTENGLKRVYPIGENGVERVWRNTGDTALKLIAQGKLKASDSFVIYQTIESCDKNTALFSNWTDQRYNAGTNGAMLLENIMGSKLFGYPKSLYTVLDAIESIKNLSEDAVILDYFGGSGTTAHAVIESNRVNDTYKKYILIEVGEHFNKVLRPRIEKIIYASGWKDGKPVSRTTGISHCFKYLTLESYEDALSNINLPDEQNTRQMIMRFGDEYLVKYMLDLDATGSILNLDAFKEPFSYMLNITEKNETKRKAVDLVETFNYLIGLTVTRMYARRSFNAKAQVHGEYEGSVELSSDVNGKYTFRQIEGTLRDGQRVLVIWRNISDNIRESNAALDAYFARYRINPADREFSVIYVNGDNNVENLRKDDETWKVRMIEPEFKERMFEEK